MTSSAPKTTASDKSPPSHRHVATAPPPIRTVENQRDRLQRRLGNQRLHELLLAKQADASARRTNGGRLQAKLTVNIPGDVHEQEADRIADAVMRMPGPSARSDAAVETVAPPAQVQTRALPASDGGGIAAPPIVHEVLSSPGQPLDAATRAFMDPRFGRDFGDVRVHADDRSASASRAIDAKAFAHGQHVVFGSGQYRPASQAGLGLIAHELTHVIQQGRNSSAIQRKPDTGYVDHGASPHAMGVFDAKSGIYTVPDDQSIYPDQGKPYDTLFSIAKRFGTTGAAILQLNGPEASKLNPGQKIRLPKANSKTEAKVDSSHKESSLEVPPLEGIRKLPAVEHPKRTDPDLKSIARNVWNAMFGGLTGLGTDEKVVYENLAKLNHDKTLIDGFKKVYKALNGSEVLDDIRSEFSNTWWAGDELTTALSYLREPKPPNAKRAAKRETVQERRREPATAPLSFHHNADVVLTASMQGRLSRIGVRFTHATGRVMFVNSGTRGPHKQAAAMYDKFAAGADGSDYTNQQALREIRQAYRAGVQAGLSRAVTVANMTSIIENQVARGILISAHMSGRGADIRTIDLSSAEQQRLEEAVRQEGGRVHPEGNPPHLHIQFDTQ